MPASLSRSINLEWIYQSRNIGLGLSAHSLSASGAACRLWRDSETARQYFVETLAAAPQGGAPRSGQPPQVAREAEFQADAITRASCYPGGLSLYATSGSELYFLWHDAHGNLQSLALPIRQGDRFKDLQAGGEDDSNRTAAILTLDAKGQSTVTLVESPDPSSHGGVLRVAWSKTWPEAVSAIALSNDAAYLGVATGSSVSLIDSVHRTVWSASVGGNGTIAALAVGTNGDIASIDQSGSIQCYGAPDGAVRWQLNIPVGESSLPSSMAAGLICSDTAMSVVLCALNRVDAFGELEAEYLLLDGASGDLLWEDMATSPINGVSIAAGGAYSAISTQNGATTLISHKDRLDPSAPIARALAERVQELVVEAKSAYQSRGDAVGAVRLLNDALDLNPGLCVGIGYYDDAVWNVRMDALAETKTVSAQSLTQVEAALALLPNDEKLTVRRNALARLLAESIAREAAVYLAESRLEDAIAKYVEALTIDRTLPEIRASLLTATDQLTIQLLKQADAAFYDERFPEAIGLLERVSMLRPSESAITRRLERAQGLQAYATAMQLYVGKQFEESVFWFKKTLTIIPEHQDAARFLGYAESNVKARAAQPTSGAEAASASPQMGVEPAGNPKQPDPEPIGKPAAARR